MHNSEKILNKIKKFVQEQLKNAESGHDFNHSLRVLKNVELISKGKKVDLKSLQIAALTHDLIDEKIFKNSLKQKQLLIDFFKESNLTKSEIKKILFLIENVSYRKKYQGEKTEELKILEDADRLDAIGAIGIARAFSYGGFKKRDFFNSKIKNYDSINEKENTTINHFYEKLLKLRDKMNTREAKKIAEHRHNFMLEFLQEFFDEWFGKK